MLLREFFLLLIAGWTSYSLAQTPTSPPYAFAQCNSLDIVYSQSAHCESEYSNRNTRFSGSARADPRQGILRLFGNTTVANGEYAAFSGIFSTGLADTIDFGGAAAFEGAVHLRVHGRLIGDIPLTSDSAILSSLTVGPYGAARMSASFREGRLVETEHEAFNWGSGQTDILSLTDRIISVDLTVPFSWTPHANPLSLFAQISGWPALERPGSFGIDLGHTALLSIEVPANQPFTSGSGVLLTSPIPEPASSGLLLAGFVCFALVLPRTRRMAEAIGMVKSASVPKLAVCQNIVSSTAG